MRAGRDVKEMIQGALKWLAVTGVVLMYKYVPDAPEGGRHKLRIGLAAYDEDFLPYFVSRSDRQRDPDEEAPNFRDY